MPVDLGVDEAIKLFKDMPFEKKAEFLGRFTVDDLIFLNRISKKLDYRLPADKVEYCF